MRILIVDDEMVSRTKLETLMVSIGDCQTADCGTAAIDLYQKAIAENNGYDLVMLDIDMPDMHGREVLNRIRKIEDFGPHRAAVVMVTAHSDQDHVLHCHRSGCDAYIAKPFNASTVNEKLISLGLLNTDGGPPPYHSREPLNKADEIFKEVSNAVRSGQFELPVMPQIGLKFRQLIKNNADVNQLAQLLKQDMALTGKLIKVTNSVLYRGYGTVDTIEQAIGRLGLTETEQMVTALSNQRLFNIAASKYKITLQHLWQHSLASAYAAEFLTKTLNLKLAIDGFSAGLLHDIGALALLNVVAQMESRGRYKAGVDPRALSETVQNYHAMFGAKLLEVWGFDIHYIRATLSHNNLYAAESLTDEVLVVHFANLVAKSIGYCADGQPFEVDLAATPSARELKLDESQIDALKKTVLERTTLSEEVVC